MIRVLHGDCREALKTLADGSVQCVVTSPPYYGLRDYGTAQWEGGDPCHEHDRVAARNGRGGSGSPGKQTEGAFPSTVPSEVCSCGARRIDAQIGLEPTPDEYIQTMVEVFREVRRVLRDDGVCFVNMGDSYASGASRPSRFQADAPAYDSDGTEPEGSPAFGSVCPDLCGECRGSLLSHSVHRIDLLEAVLRRENADGHQPSDVPRVSPVSTMRRSLQQPQASRSEVSSRDVECLLCGRSLADGAAAFVRMEACNRDNERRGSAGRTQDMDASGLASPGYTTASHRYKPKDLLMMPARLALALQADGWFIRSAITWCKPSPMPESVTDRPTSATEMVYLLTKRATYFYDSIAIREPSVSDHPSGNGYKRDARLSYADDNGARGNDASWTGTRGTRNARNWWVINSEPFPHAHFAVFPSALAERCIRAGTSERGACSACGAPWVREIAVDYRKNRPSAGNDSRSRGEDKFSVGNGSAGFRGNNLLREATTTGWRASCQCNAETRPCVVLDPFGGAGTVGLAADRLQRDAVLIELNEEYVGMAKTRIADDAPLFAGVETVDHPVSRRA